MSEMDEQSGVEETLSVNGPGHRLREARESRKLTIAQAAAQLRMQSRIIEALENDDYSTLPGTIFVQGYLRSYSRLLGLPEASILGLAHAESVAEPELVSSISGGKAEVTSRDLPFRMVSFLILLLVVIGLGWWLSQREPVITQEAPQVVSPGDEQGLLIPQVEEQLPETEQMESVPGEADTESDAVEADTPAQEEEVEQGQPEVEPSPAIEPPQAAVETPHSAAPVTLSDGTPQSLLVLEYQADSWSEIVDAAGRKLAYGLIPSGRSLQLRGEAPFKVFLGFASGVTVYYNGDLYDHTPYQRGDVARFRIGRAEHNRPLAGN
jgi:cytoskeleton protein RodZ